MSKPLLIVDMQNGFINEYTQHRSKQIVRAAKSFDIEIDES